ncbi:MAG: LamG-like jellyroll fold domain-containing protein, partial [Bacteroidota bacterium]
IGSGVILTNDRFFSNNSAYEFNGSGNISLTSQPTIGAQDFTISGWVKTNNTSVRKGIACWGQDMPWQSTYFYITNTGYLNFDFAYNGGPQSSTFISDNQWHHVAVTCINGLVQLYLDGQTTATPLQMNPNINGSNKALGANIDNSGSNNFVGSLDDIGIWNRALTQQEITNLYTSSTPPPCNPLAANLQNGLVGYWPFCGNANDESGNGNNGTVNGATLTADRFGAANSAYSFDGNADYIDCGNNNTLNLSNTLTLSAWINASTFGQEKGIISKSFGAVPYTYDLIVSNNGGPKVRLDINQNFLFSTQTLNTNQWYHIVAVYDGSIQSIYIDGVLSSSQNANTVLNSIADHLILGAHQVSVVPGWSWDGKLDDIAIWNRALTQNEITQLYTGSPCVNYQIITVTDTLIINANLSGINPVTFQNTIKVYPNPSSSQITIDFGANFNTLAGYTMRIQNAVGQTVYTTGVTQQQYTSNLNTWTGNGMYFVYLIDAQGNTVDVKKIILQ